MCRLVPRRQYGDVMLRRDFGDDRFVKA